MEVLFSLGLHDIAMMAPQSPASFLNPVHVI